MICGTATFCITMVNYAGSIPREASGEIAVYNRTAENPIVYGTDAEIRYQIAVGYLALIEEVEKYVRYEPEEENYIRNTVDAAAMFDMAFSILL